MKMKDYLRLMLIGTLAMAVACGDDDDDGMMEPPEEITTVNVTLTGGGETLSGTVRDLDGEGGMDATIDNPGALTAGTTYTLSVELLNENETPVEDVTEEIREEAEEHQFFFVPSGDVVTVQITDVESDYGPNLEGEDLPVGLAAEVEATAAGSGQLRVVLKHLPPINESPQKTPATTINDGESDVDVTFDITVQ